jgi:hypothetical protein
MKRYGKEHRDCKKSMQDGEEVSKRDTRTHMIKLVTFQNGSTGKVHDIVAVLNKVLNI